MLRTVSTVALLATLSACATNPRVVRPPPLGITRGPPMAPTGLERVLGQPSRTLVALFGDADQDVREAEGARRLQFVGPICILDAYLYPPKTGSSDAIVSYVDARQPDGRDIDRASCVAALTRRREAR